MKKTTGQVIKVQLDVSMGDVCSHFERMPVRARARDNPPNLSRALV